MSLQEAREKLWDVIIVGAGLAGIHCARQLQAAGVETLVLEKSRSFGGRCATRTWDGCLGDHGVPFFEESAAGFMEAAKQAAGGDLDLLEAPLLGPDGNPLPLANGRRYSHRRGAQALAKALAAGLNVLLEQHIVSLRQQGDKTWHAITQTDGVWRARRLILTAPWPQTAVFLRTFTIFHQGPIGADRAKASYRPCLSALFVYEGQPPAATGFALGRQGVPGCPWELTILENHKPGHVPPDRTLIIAHGSREWSVAHVEQKPEEWLPLLRPAVEEAWRLNPKNFRRCYGHRWLYAMRLEPPPEPGSYPERKNFFLAGDCITASGVEEAWQSGAATARQVLASL